MNLKQYLNKSLQQWPAKVICLIIAIFLYVFHQVSLIDKKTFVVPLTIQENGCVIHVGTVPSSVGITIRTSTDNMKFISANEIKALVNLDTITEKGTYDVPVSIILSDNMTSLDPLEVRLKDKSFNIEVDTKKIKYVNIEPSIVGKVAHGYEIQSVEITPATVQISGPETILNKIEKVDTSRIIVSNAENSFSTDATIVNSNRLISIDEDNILKAEINVVPQYVEKDFVVPVDYMNLSDKFIYESNVSDVTLKLLGTVTYLENYHVPRRSVQVYLGDIREPGVYELPLRFYFTTNTEILEKSDEVVTVTITAKNVEPESVVEEEKTE